MLQDHSRNLVKLFFPSRISLLFESYKSLEFKLDRGKRILDFMSHLTSHLTPRVISFSLGKLSGRIGQIAHHSVISIDQRRNLILALVDDIFQIIDISRVHLPTHLDQRCKHRVHLSCTEQKRTYEKKEKQIYDHCCMEQRLSSEVETLVRVRNCNDGDKITLTVKYRSIKSP